MKKRKIFLPIIILALLVTTGIFLWSNRSKMTLSYNAYNYGDFDYVAVIDAGHGGVDGGAVSVSGRNEKEYNLEIALKAELFLRFLGVSTSMIRTDDRSIHDASAQTIREKKVSDLKNRTKLANASANGVLISLHQNFFDDSSVNGAQVFYNNHEGSKPLAAIMQNNIALSGLSKKERSIQKKLDTYLMENTKIPVVLVECGFLSSYSDEALLNDPKYQLKFAQVLGISLIEWAHENKRLQ